MKRPILPIAEACASAIHSQGMGRIYGSCEGVKDGAEAEAR
ncbi:hypothetical protein [Fibrobacter sp. UBA4309]|nr:hypothetical protein [Fibrobacter sp. UBA4309]